MQTFTVNVTKVKLATDTPLVEYVEAEEIRVAPVAPFFIVDLGSGSALYGANGMYVVATETAAQWVADEVPVTGLVYEAPGG